MKLLPVCFALLTGCASSYEYTVPEDSDFEPKMKITWVRLSTKAMVQAFCAESMPRDSRIRQDRFGFPVLPQPIACASWNHASRECTIYTERTVSLSTLGHETLHCFEGEWHR